MADITQQIQSMLNYMLAQKGKPYNDTNPARFGPGQFDCSGLIWAAAKHAGINFSQGIALAPSEVVWFSQQKGAKAFTNPNEIQAGDILGFVGADPGPGVGGSLTSKWGNMGHIGMATSPTEYISAYDTQEGISLNPIAGDKFVAGVHLANNIKGTGSQTGTGVTESGGSSSGPPTTTVAWWGPTDDTTSTLNPISQAGNIIKDITGTASDLADVAVAIKGLAVTVGTVTHWLSWVFAPSSWARIGSFILGIILLLLGIYALRKAVNTPQVSIGA